MGPGRLRRFPSSSLRSGHLPGAGIAYKLLEGNRTEQVMLRRAIIAAIVVASAATLRAQDMRTTDARLYPFLGCWRSDTIGTRAAQAGALTCVVPVSGTADVDVVSLVDGRIADRHRIESDMRAHAIDGQGCKGQEKTLYSPLGRRVYLRAEYACASTGVTGGTTTLNSFLPTGEWLEVVHV